LAAFELLVPTLIRIFEQNAKDTAFAKLAEPIQILKNWDYRSNENSVATTLAIEWAQRLNPAIQKVYIELGELDQVAQTRVFAEKATAQDVLPPLQATVADLTQRFGTWQVSWGEVNRFQRHSGAIDQPFDDSKPSLAVGYASSMWGCLPAYKSVYHNGSKKRYGVNGNSFVCAVEFGQRIRAKSLLAGGVNGNPSSKHFYDQAERYAKGQFKDVLFYKEDVVKNAEKTYHPGQ
jgi:acyl-homoserine-lactone acylase